jgi:hypothetical protein
MHATCLPILDSFIDHFSRWVEIYNH